MPLHKHVEHQESLSQVESPPASVVEVSVSLSLHTSRGGLEQLASSPARAPPSNFSGCRHELAWLPAGARAARRDEVDSSSSRRSPTASPGSHPPRLGGDVWQWSTSDYGYGGSSETLARLGFPETIWIWIDGRELHTQACIVMQVGRRWDASAASSGRPETWPYGDALTAIGPHLGWGPASSSSSPAGETTVSQAARSMETMVADQALEFVRRPTRPGGNGAPHIGVNQVVGGHRFTTSRA